MTPDLIQLCRKLSTAALHWHTISCKASRTSVDTNLCAVMVLASERLDFDVRHLVSQFLIYKTLQVEFCIEGKLWATCCIVFYIHVKLITRYYGCYSGCCSDCCFIPHISASLFPTLLADLIALPIIILYAMFLFDVRASRIEILPLAMSLVIEAQVSSHICMRTI